MVPGAEVTSVYLQVEVLLGQTGEPLDGGDRVDDYEFDLPGKKRCRG